MNFRPSTGGNEDGIDSGQIHPPEKLQIKMLLIDNAIGCLNRRDQSPNSQERGPGGLRLGSKQTLDQTRKSSRCFSKPFSRPRGAGRDPTSPRGARSVS